MLRFEWDAAKADSNWRKHRVRFEDAMLVFADPDAVVEEDHSSEEIRWRILGLSGTGGLSGTAVLLLAVYTSHEENGDEIIRIISARKATRKERKRYGENRAKDVFF
jgi:uncharacterized DUF497 family protein